MAARPSKGLTSDLARRLDAAIGRYEPDALDLLRRLIQTPSVSGSEGRHDEPGTVGGLIWTALGTVGGVERAAEEVIPDRDNVIALIRGTHGPIIVLDAHTDTVPAGGPAHWIDGDPYSAREGEVAYLGDDRIRLSVGRTVVERPFRQRLSRLWEARNVDRAPVLYGRGSFDNKGPVAVAYLAIITLANLLETAQLQLGGTLVAGFTIDEEQEMQGIRAFAGGSDSWLDRHGLLPPLREGRFYRDGIVGVALDGSYGFVPVVGHRGIAQLLLRTRGQAAHAATPSLGINAVTAMAAVLHSLDRDADSVQSRLGALFSDDLLEPISLALGTTIVGGGVQSVTATPTGVAVDRSGINVVPDWCEATIDCRFPRPSPGISAISEQIAADLTAIACQATGLSRDDLAITVLGEGPPCAIVASAATAADDSLVAAVLRHGSEVSGFPLWVETAPGGTDATVMINEGQIRTLVEFGPAGALAHEPHEFVERDQIAVGATILARTIVDLLGVEPRSERSAVADSAPSR